MKRLLLFAAFIAAIGTASCQSQDTTGRSFDRETYELQKQPVNEHYANHDSIQALDAEIERMKNEILIQGKEIKELQTNLVKASNFYHEAEVCLGVSIGFAVASGILYFVNSIAGNYTFLNVLCIGTTFAALGTGVSSIVMWSKGNKALKGLTFDPY